LGYRIISGDIGHKKVIVRCFSQVGRTRRQIAVLRGDLRTRSAKRLGFRAYFHDWKLHPNQ